ncbi:glutathione-disulfide reductase [filamentous cyanobacterium CCP5]|nr:glutathione-disulfide reductase [filamentous cyanobacterium CCP5]
MTQHFDYFVIGGGSGGIASARRAAEYGAKVGIAEVGRLGGTCVNRGCVPKKLMVYASHFPEQFEAAKGYGWTIGETQFDWTKMITAVNNETQRLNGIYQRMLDNSGVTLYRQYARFVDEQTLLVGDEKVTADKILIAVGGRPVLPTNVPGIEHAISSDDIFHLSTYPRRMVILGGGYIGCEFASLLARLGVEVTQIIRGEQILKGFDDDLRNEVQMGMEQSGVKLMRQSQITAIEKNGEAGVEITVHDSAGDHHMFADAVSLAATGRKPNVEKLGLDCTSIKLNDADAILVDEHHRTAVEHIFAIGDVTDRVNLTPVAIKEGRILADTYFGNKPAVMDYENIPTAVFTTPELGTVGLSETEAKQIYGESAIKVYRSRFRPMFYTLPDIQTKTLMKLVVHGETDQVLGAHMTGDDAAEIIQSIAIAVKMGATKAQFDATVALHPSAAEEFVTMR